MSMTDLRTKTDFITNENEKIVTNLLNKMKLLNMNHANNETPNFE